MTTRWNLVLMSRAVQEPMRTQDVSRRSGRLVYWLGVPLGPLLLYGALAWTASALLSPVARAFKGPRT